MTYYTINISDETADLLVTDVLRDIIERESDIDEQLLKSLVETHNFFSVPSKHIKLADTEDA